VPYWLGGTLGRLWARLAVLVRGVSPLSRNTSPAERRAWIRAPHVRRGLLECRGHQISRAGPGAPGGQASAAALPLFAVWPLELAAPLALKARESSTKRRCNALAGSNALIRCCS
jgi:hypothetical protein